MVVGNQYVQPQGLGVCHTGHAGNAVVYGHDELRLALGGHFGQLRGEAVAVLEAVGHQKIHLGAHARQANHRHGAGGGTVGIVVGHNQNTFLVGNGAG